MRRRKEEEAEEQKRREDDVDLGDAVAGICFHGNMQYEEGDDVPVAIIIINLPAVLSSKPTALATLLQLAQRYAGTLTVDAELKRN